MRQILFLLPLLGGVTFPLLAEECLQVAGERIFSRDLHGAEGSPPALVGGGEVGSASPTSMEPGMDLGPAPLPGFKRYFTFEKEGKPTTVCVVRLTKALERDRVLQAVQAAVERALGPNHGAQIELVDHARQLLPEGALELAARPQPPRAGADVHEPLLWQGKLQASPRHSYPIWAKVRISEQAVCLEATRDLPGRKPVPDDGFVEVRRVRNPMLARESCLSNLAQVRGTVLLRGVKKGEILRAAQLKHRPAIVTGDNITAEWRGREARLRFPVQAETEGNAGETIFVRSPTTGRRFQALVMGPGIVNLKGQ